MAYSNNKMLISLYLMFILFYSSFPSPSLSELCHPEEKETLLQIKNALGNPDILSSWDPQTDCCGGWQGVTCNYETYWIQTLSIINGTYRATIPPQVGDLRFLETLMFLFNRRLRGPIPPEIAKLTNLGVLVIAHTRISGEIPDFLCQMTSLGIIQLDSNNLTGSIPGGLADLPNLRLLKLDKNAFTGSIPDSFGRFKRSDIELGLSHNNLSGQIPASLGEMVFWRIDLTQNNLEGDAAMLFGASKSTLAVLHLSRNLLSFNLSTVTFPPSLADFDISHNMIFGSLPQELTELSLYSFNVSDNRLCGEIPLGGQLQTFDASAYSDNLCLCGPPLPECQKLAQAGGGMKSTI